MEIDMIKQSVHLIFYFQSMIIKIIDSISKQILNIYINFWINNHIDLYIYNMIY